MKKRPANLTAEEEVLEAFVAMTKALSQGDTRALDALFADDFLGFDPQGRPEDRNLILEVYGVGGLRIEHLAIEDLNIQVVGNVGILSGRGVIRRVLGEETFEQELRFTNLFVRRNETWQIVGSQLTPIASEAEE